MWIVMIKSLRYYIKIVMPKKLAHPDEIQNTKIDIYERTNEGNK